jgi:hypothetical protein
VSGEASSALERLRSMIVEQGGPLAEALTPSRGGEAFGPLVAGGTRTRSRNDDYRLLVESIFEGFLLHYGDSRLLDPDDDLRLLGGDFLYAFGLTKLAKLGDLDAIVELADLITLCARIQVDDDDCAGRMLALWSLASLSVAGGSWPQLDHHKQELVGSSAGSVNPALENARERAAQLGLELELQRALIAFKEMVRADIGTT